MAHGYETGRLNLPFVGIATFGKYPLCLDWDRIEADVAVLGAPFDFGTQWRAGARFGPRAIREASTLFSFGHAGAYDHEDDVVYLAAETTRIVDIGDADIIHTDTIGSHANIEAAVRQDPRRGRAAGHARRRSLGHHPDHRRLLRARADPHRAVRCASRLRRRASRRPLRSRQPDAARGGAALRHRPHPARHPQRLLDRARGLCRRAARWAPTSSASARSASSARRRCSTASRRARATTSPSTSTGSIRRSRREPARPAMAASPITRCSSFCAGIARRGSVVGIDLVEVAPDYDHTGTTAILAAQLLLNFIGRVLHARSA